MPCPHNEISIVQRSNRQSAVAAAAYQSGEKLFCEYDQEVKHYPEKRGIVHNEILLPANAPPEYADRSTLWNAAEAIEKQWNSQLARRWVLSIPREIPPDQYAALVRDFCNQQFVSKGMCVDFAIHDKGDGNPHAHVMLTMRAMDERGKWLPKSRKVYDLNENGERIKLPSGRWKSHKEDTVDWNDRKYCEIWRHEWEVIQNRYLEANNRPERVDLRSYERQGLDIIPTVHEGAAVRQMEKRGIQTNIGNLNWEIKAANSLMQSIRQLIKNLKGWITELSEKRKELLAEKAAEEAVFLPNLLMKYMEVRKAERSNWTRAGQSRGTSQDLKAVSEALSYLQRKGLSTVEDLENFIETSGKSAADYRKQMKPKETRSNVIDAILAARTDCKECKPVYEKYQKIFFKKTKEKFKLEHPEVARFEKASAYLAKHPDDKDSTKKELLQEQAKLVGEIADLKVPLTEVQEDLKKLRDIRYWVRKATPGTEESKEPPKKQPLKEVLQDMVDVTNPAEIVGWGDYVFVARVESELRTEYTNLRQNEDGTITGKPYTVYSITVLENIKGELRKNEPIEFFKHGGVNYDGLSISLLEGDQLLESGKTYILIAASEADGRLGQGMPNSSIELDLSQRQSYSTKSEYSSYCEYVRDEVECERTRYHSMYENSSESRIDE